MVGKWAADRTGRVAPWCAPSLATISPGMYVSWHRARHTATITGWSSSGMKGSALMCSYRAIQFAMSSIAVIADKAALPMAAVGYLVQLQQHLRAQPRRQHREDFPFVVQPLRREFLQVGPAKSLRTDSRVERPEQFATIGYLQIEALCAHPQELRDLAVLRHPC